MKFTMLVRRTQAAGRPVEVEAESLEEAKRLACEAAEEELYSDQWDTLEMSAEPEIKEGLTLTLRDGERVRLVPAPDGNGYVMPDLFTFPVGIEREENGWKASCLCVGEREEGDGYATCGNHKVGETHLHSEEDYDEPNASLVTLIEVLWYG